jgi:UDP:flavonoid glycosyltransferase YjiC (YdhE family)
MSNALNFILTDSYAFCFQDIEKFISESGDEGFILVSFGGEAKISSIPKETLDIFFKAFERRKVRILLKWEKERPKELPAHVLTVPWYPQKEILGML